MIRNTDGTERLYLSKKADETIVIDNCRIPQHNIDGIRFLYRQFKKKKPGVIINDTVEYNKNLHIVLFLKAVNHLLKQPVLILCQEGAEHGWMEQFDTWTDLCDGVVLETQKPHIKKQVLINTMANLSSFCNRNWSLLIVDLPELDKAAQQVFGLPFKTDFKIWITPLSMKENLDQFTKIYKWLYPKGDFDQNHYKPDRANLSDVVDKSILLEAFMEDIVVRNVIVESAVENCQIKASAIRKISLKNKDATGTKIKRSKRKINDEDDTIPLSKLTKDDLERPTTNKREGPLSKNQEDNYDISIDDNTPISTITKDEVKALERPTTSKSAESLSKNQENNFSIDNLKRQSIESPESPLNDKEQSDSSQVTLFYEPDLTDNINSDRLYEMDTQILDHDACNEQIDNIYESTENYIETNESNLLFRLEQDEDISKDNKLGIDDRTLNDFDKNAEEESKHSIINNDIFPPPSSIFKNKSENNVVNQENYISIEQDSSSICNEFKPNIDVLSRTKDSLSSICDEVSPGVDEENKIIASDEVQLESNYNEVNDKDLDKTNIGVKADTLKRSCFEDKMKEMEEKAMKKFKGSIFDTLF